MKNLLFTLLLIIPLSVSFAGGVTFSITQKTSDTAVVGSSFTYHIAVNTLLSPQPSDSLYMKPYLITSLGAVTYSNFVGLQYSQIGFGAGPNGPNQYGTTVSTDNYSFTFAIPNNPSMIGKWVRIMGSYYSGNYLTGAIDSIYIASNTPDISFTSTPLTSGYKNDIQQISIKWSYIFGITDSLKILFDGIEQGSVSLYNKTHSILSYTINTATGVKSVTFVNYTGSYSFTVLSTTTRILDPLSLKNVIVKYYNIQGEEIQKPTEGFFIWKTDSGLSGKSIISY